MVQWSSDPVVHCHPRWLATKQREGLWHNCILLYRHLFTFSISPIQEAAAVSRPLLFIELSKLRISYLKKYSYNHHDVVYQLTYVRECVGGCVSERICAGFVLSVNIFVFVFQSARVCEIICACACV